MKEEFKKRIDEKIKEIEKYLEELYQHFPSSYEEYTNDSFTKAACERYFEKIIVAIIDLAFLFSRYKELESPKEEEQIFLVLENKKIINSELSKRLKEAKGMRNFIVHEYGEIDDELVFNSIAEELEEDTKEFISDIKKTL
ncbi:DUF86 domain-containing protein [Candidatus Pacearchaeota archaeon]|nr:DUF86 domain-containing protein [Candidatus Pacearchaeota archaeon]